MVKRPESEARADNPDIAAIVRDLGPPMASGSLTDQC